tara:strand:- start:2480 stop:3046 length:567 start_codon:yes stop_codon:yes gene_type:complete
MAVSEIEGVVGNMMAEPRVFAHDAKQIVVGAINNTTDVDALEITNDGANYVVGTEVVATGVNGGALASGQLPLKIIPTEIGGLGELVKFTISDPGSGYAPDDLITFAPTGALEFKVLDVDIPNTRQRGCCLYVGTPQLTLRVEMESGSDTIFRGVPAGSFLPIQVVRVIDYGTRATDSAGVYPIIALY